MIICKNRIKVASWAITLIITTLAFVMMANTASANSRGQCNVSPGNTVTSTSEWLGVLRKEGVTGQVGRVFNSAGYRSYDQNLRQWMSQRVIRTKSHRSFRAVDYGCRGGNLFSVGIRSYGKGKQIFVVMPLKYSKADFRTRKSGGYTKKVAISVKVIGLSDCGNPVIGTTTIIVWVKGSKPSSPSKPKPTPKPTPAPTPEVVVSCPTGTNWNGSQCVGNVNQAEQDCRATVGGTWNGDMCVNTQTNNNCGNTNVGSGNNASGDNCNTTNICSNVNSPAGVVNCTVPPQAKSIKITSSVTLNDIPVGKNSGPFTLTVNASESGGSVTVDPGIGAVSKCDSTTPVASATFSSLPAGNSELCVIFYAPSDPARPTSMTISMVATLGSSSDIKSQTFAITYPVRP